MTHVFKLRLLSSKDFPMVNVMQNLGVKVCLACFVAITPLENVLGISNPQETLYTYTVEGLVDTIDGPRNEVGISDVIDVNYDSSTLLPNEIIYSKGEVNLTYQFSSFNAIGLPEKIIDPNGISIERSYSYRGWLKSKVVVDPVSPALDAMTSYLYDPTGNISCITDPMGNKILYIYDDAQRLVGVIESANDCDVNQNSSGNLKRFVLDSASNILFEEIHDGYTDSDQVVFRYSTVYDELSRSIESTFQNDGRIEYDYTDNGRVEKITEAVNGLGDTRITDVSYDSLDRPYKSIDALGNPTTVSYASNGKVKEVVDAKGSVTTYTYDEFGNLKTISSPDSGYQQLIYDDANNLVSITNGLQVTKLLDYDGLNRLKSITYPSDANENLYFYYDNYQMDVTPDPAESNSYPVGKLTGINGPSSGIRFYYDHRGNVTKQKNNILDQTFNVEYAYNLNDQIKEIVYPNGLTVFYEYDNSGKVNAVNAMYKAVGDTSQQLYPLISNIDYMPFGPEKTIQYSNGVTIEKVWDLDYRLDLVSVKDGQNNLVKNADYQYTALGNIEAINDSVLTQRDQNYEYDLLDRVTHDDSLSLTPTPTYEYDSVGNRLAFFSDNPLKDVIQSYSTTYDNAGNRMDTITYGNISPISLNYDDAGNILFKERQFNSVGGSDYIHQDTYNYGLSGRLSSTTIVTSEYQAGILLNSNTTNVSYKYNPLGQRIYKSVVEGQETLTNYFLYDLSGRTIGDIEYGSSTGVDPKYRFWIYANGAPIIQFSSATDSNGQLLPEEYIYHSFYANHLGVTELGFSHSGEPVWQMDMTAFGESVEISHLTSIESEKLYNPLRFPGQYHDVETGLFYNYYRDYDPNLGRYLQSDPIGLQGGVNTYSYVVGNPLKYTDRLGLDLDIDPRVESFVNNLTSGSSTANIFVGTLRESSSKYQILKTDAANYYDPASGTVYFNPELAECYEFLGEDGNWHPFTPERALGHELGHAYMFANTPMPFDVVGALLDKARGEKMIISGENKIAREMDPNAPQRAQYDIRKSDSCSCRDDM